jgi:phage tail tape-measure protein
MSGASNMKKAAHRTMARKREKANKVKPDEEEDTMLSHNKILKNTAITVLAGALLFTGCSGGPLTTREKGAGIGALGGAATGGIVGAAVGHPGAGAAIGGALGLGAGALVGDQLQGQQNTNYRQQQQINRNQYETDRNRQEIQRLQRQRGEY